MRISANASSNYLTDRLKFLGVGFSKGARCSFILILTAWSKFNNLLAQGFFGFVRRVPGQVVAVVALLLYPGAGLILPLVLKWPLPGLVATRPTPSHGRDERPPQPQR
jgi:hypothetical protein